MFVLIVLTVLFVLAGKSAPSVPTAEAIESPPIDPAATPSLIQQGEQEIQVDLRTGQIISQTAAAAAGSATGIAGSAALIGLTATSWTVIGGAIVGAIELINALRSDTHLYANELVQKFENPFGKYLSTIINHETELLNAGILTHIDADAMYSAVRDTWQRYEDTMHQLMLRSRDWLIVSKQSLNNLDGQYAGEILPNGKVLGQGMTGPGGGPFITAWLDWMHDRVMTTAV